MKKIYSKFTRNRDRRFQIETSIFSDGGKKYVSKRALEDCGKEHIKNMYEHYQMHKKYDNNILVNSFMENDEVFFDFVEGESLLSELLKITEKRDKKEFEEFLLSYKTFIWDSSAGEKEAFSTTSEFKAVFGDTDGLEGLDAGKYVNIDCTLDNIIVTDANDKKVIDYEWIFDFPIPFEFVLYRALYAFYVKFYNGKDVLYSFKEACELLGISEDKMKIYKRMDKYFLRYVCGETENYEKILDQYKKEQVSYSNLYANRILYAQLYYDIGDGFSENNSLIYDLPFSERQNVEFVLPTKEKIKTIRIDLCNVNAGVRIKSIDILNLYGKNIEFTEISDNSDIKENDIRIFNNADMNIVYKLVEQEIVDRVIVDYEISFLDTDIIKINNTLKVNEGKNIATVDFGNKINEYNNIVQDLNTQISEISIQKQEYEQLYNDIYYSFYWRATKPLRASTDLLKKCIKKNKLTYKMAKGVKCAKQHGVSYTVKRGLKKIKRKVVKSNNSGSNAFSTMENQLTVEEIPENIKFSILVPLYNTETKYLKEMIGSVIAQKYTNWELCLADGSSEGHEDVEQVCLEYSKNDSRIKYNKLVENLGISNNTNECAKMAEGEYIVLFDHDDLMNCMALYENAKAIYATDADVLYSDEDHVTESGEHISPLFKPDWSRDLLYSQMYICHLLVFKRKLFDEIGGFRSEFDGSQDYDLMLRFSEKTENIIHIPKLLYSWRETQTSTAKNADSKPYAHYAGINALNDHLKRKYGDYAHGEASEYTFVYEARFDLMKEDTLVSIIMPMKDHADLSRDCIDSILEKTTHSNYEILILDNNSEEQETFEWFEEVQKKDSRIKVLKADFEFNWSKLNNFGIKHAKGDVFVFLNNDIVIISEDWLQRLGENALREDIGVVGPLLLFEDNTIQHAGIVVGIGGWADHLFRGMNPVHYGSPYISPMISRNVSAVTGACMVISRNTIDKIGNFDESFLVCGSDVEICMRAYFKGLNNMYNSRVRLYHLESKSRDAKKVPKIDFKRSYECYAPFRENGDPYYNINLELSTTTPTEKADKSDIVNSYDYLNNSRFSYKNIQLSNATNVEFECKEELKVLQESELNIPEIQPITPRAFDSYSNMRLNILSPSVDKKHVFGGISTALKFYEALGAALGCDLRIIVTDAAIDMNNSIDLSGYELVDSTDDSTLSKQLVGFSDRFNKTIPVGKNDIFVATGWWTAYTIEKVIEWQAEYYNQELKSLIYMIQDYEPGFYPWSSRYLMADSTYKMNVPTVAVINSGLLYDFMNSNYKFNKIYYFEPVLNESLRKYLIDNKDSFKRKKQIIIYGRPSVARNAFELIVASLKEWAATYKSASEWKIVSAGESFADVNIGNGMVIHSVGKLNLEEYGKMMLETSIGISLMVSPHPSYPPLEMSTFGVRTITNCYGNKNLEGFNENIISIEKCSQTEICRQLSTLCDSFSTEGKVIMNPNYVKEAATFGDVVDNLSSDILNKEV